MGTDGRTDGRTVRLLYASQSFFVAYKLVSMVMKHHNLTLQTKPQHREEEPQNIYRNKTSVRQLKQSNQLSLPLQDDCKTRMETVMHNKTKTNTEGKYIKQ